MKELKEAYRDAISVWHPDRFSGNSRLRCKAEQKAALINEAYRILSDHIARLDGPAVPEDGSGGRVSEEGRVERIAETGTRAVLHAGHAIYSVLRRLASSR